MAGMDLAAICEVLKGTQQPDGAARKAAEQRLDEAASGSPNQLVGSLSCVLAAPNGVAVELRQEAAVLLRQLVDGSTGRPCIWPELEGATRKALMTQLLGSLEHEPSRPVKRNVGQAASAVANAVADDVPDLMREWPELLPVLSRFVGSDSNVASRVVALEILKDLVPSFGEGLMEKREQVLAMLSGTLADIEPEVRAAAAKLVLQLVEDLEPEDAQPLVKVMPAVTLSLQSFAKGVHEEQLKETLEALISAADEEPEFFRDSGLEALWPTLVELSAAGPAAFADPEVRHSAMEAAMSLAVGLCEDFAKPEGQVQLERLIGLNIEWMLEVEEDVSAWTAEGKDDNEDECDDDVVENAESNLDRLAEKIDEDVFMPLLFKLIRAAGLAPGADWRHARAAVMALSQVVEHIDETAWIDQCIDFLLPHLTHPHPRVRFAAFMAVGQVAYDHTPHVQNTHHEVLLPAIVVGLKDTNIRVATNAVGAFTSLAQDEYLDCEDLEPHMEELLLGMFSRLSQGETRAMQESCLSGIATVAEVMEELFAPFYSSVIPALKQIIVNATGEKDRSLRGKAFECISTVGLAVGKETFAQDAHEVMQVMTQMVQAGFAADDPQRESVSDSASMIAEALGKDFKPYVPALLPIIFESLKHRPTEVHPGDMPDEDSDDDQPDMSLTVVDGKVLGLKTSVLEEMEESLSLMRTFVESLEEEFCEFLPATCQNLLPLLEIQLSKDLQEKAFKTWEALVQCARSGVQHGRMDRSALQELVTVFLEKIVGALNKTAQSGELDEDALQKLQTRATSVSGVIRKAGDSTLTKDSVRSIAGIVAQLLSSAQLSKEEPGKGSRSKGMAPEDDEDSDTEDEDSVVTRQSLRLALADMAGAVMDTNQEDFAEVALSTYMQIVQALLQGDASENNRALAFYITDKVVDSLGERSIPFWNFFMEKALHAVVDKAAVVRQYASSTIGNGARHPIFGQMARYAASNLHRLLQKQGERHRRRRAVKADAKQAALAVDSGIRALGEICEHHEQRLGEHAGAAWGMWLSNLPLRYDEAAGQRAHKQLLRLVSNQHPAITSPQHLPQVVTVFAEVYKTKFSNATLDQDIAAAMASIGEAPLKQVCSGIQEKHQRKLEHILQGAKAGA